MTTGTHVSPGSDRAASLLRALRERPEAQLGIAYVGGAWLFYDVAELAVFVLDLPDVVLRILLALLTGGALLAVLMGRWMRLTLAALRRGRAHAGEDIRGVPDILEPALIRAAGAVSRRTTLLATTVATVAFGLMFLFLLNAWAAAHERQVPDSRITMVVFPFGEAGSSVDGLGSGLADLLSVTLDGTPGIRIVDPSSVWGMLAVDGDGAPLPPALDVAHALSRDLGASRFVVGDVLGAGSRFEISAGVYAVQDRESGGVPLRLTAHEDSLGAALERLAVDVVAVVWERAQLPTVPEIDSSATDNAQALKAYLEAKGAMRQGRLEVARESVERALALDSTFALAHLDRFRIESWLLFSQAQPSAGLRPILESAQRHAPRLTPRNRMRIDGHRALDATDGTTAAFLFERILANDSLDADALERRAFTYLAHGWQLGRSAADVADAYEAVLRADPTNTEALGTLIRVETWRGDVEAAGEWVGRLAAADTLGAYARGTIGAHEILTAQSNVVDSLVRVWAYADVGVVTTVLRDLRVMRPDLAERFLEELRADSMPTYHRRLGVGGLAQLAVARGRLVALDTLLGTGELDAVRTSLAVYQVAAALAGVGEARRAAQAATDLATEMPLDSLEAHLEARDAWITGWAVGAYHAAFGDTTEARRWGERLGSLAPGVTTVPEWPSSLAADIEARVAARRGDRQGAETWARRAFERWVVHGFDALESHPEPAIRFHFAEALRESGATTSAEPLYRSLCPPHTWMGFYTARACFELAEILLARGQSMEAARLYRMAADLWGPGDEEVVGRWLPRAREGLERAGRVRARGGGPSADSGGTRNTDSFVEPIDPRTGEP